MPWHCVDCGKKTKGMRRGRTLCGNCERTRKYWVKKRKEEVKQ